MKQRSLLVLASLLEYPVGLALLIVPVQTISFLFGAAPGDAGSATGRIAGVALLALGLGCWKARLDPGGPALAGTLSAITFYNFGAGVVLAGLVIAGKAGGVVLLSVALLHLALGLMFAYSLFRPSRAAG
jgi:hypothetical protein